jgi:WD40 repeat protein
MTDKRDFDTILRAWLDQMPSEAPDRVVASVLQATEAAPQAVALPRIGHWRSFPMNRFSISAVAVAIVALVGGGLILTRLAAPSIGGPSPSVATPSQTLGASPPPPSPHISFLPSVGQNGSIVVIVDGAAVAIAPDGSRSRLPLEGLFGQSCPTFSSDGRSLAYVADPSGYTNRLHRELRVSDADGSNSSVLWMGLRFPFPDHEVVWSPDRQHVAAAGMFPLSGSRDASGVVIGRLDGGPATFSLWAARKLSWSPDGTRLVGTRIDNETGFGVIEIHEIATDRTTTFVTVPDVGPVAWSPDGQTIWYVASSVPGGALNVHVIGVDGTNDRVIWGSSKALTSMGWSPADDLLAVIAYDDDEAGPSFTIELLDRSGAHVGSVGPISGTDLLFTWSPDGRSVLVSRPSGITGPSAALIVPLDGGEPRTVDLPADYFTACPIAWGAAAS